MFRKNKVKSMGLSSIIFLGCLFIISNLCYAQYNSTAYPGYFNWEYTEDFSMFGMYDSLFRTIIPFSMMNGLYGIYGQDGIYSSFKSPGMITGLYVLGGLGIMDRYDDIYSSYSSLVLMTEIAIKFSGLSSLDIISGVNGTRSSSIISGVGYSESPGQAGLGSLAGLGGLGSGAGLISSEATDITTYWGI
ncbi:MAG: hypothetical protein ACMUHX_07725 [bacterium]